MFEKEIERIEDQIRRYREFENADWRLYSIVQELTEIVKDQGKEIQKLKRCGCRRLKVRDK